MNIRRIAYGNTDITIKELTNYKKRFPPEFYRIYSHNKDFVEKKIYKIILKNKKTKRYNIILINDIYKLYDETIIDILENYNEKDIVFIDNYGLEHDNFYNIFDGINNIYFDWNKNTFYYNDKKSGSHYTNIYEKIKLIYYIEHKKDPIFIDSPTLYDIEISDFPT